LANPSFHLSPVPPFRLDLTVWVLRRQPHNEVDRWDGRVYRRVLVIQGETVEVAVTQSGPPEAPELRVETAGETAGPPEAASVLKAILTRILGLDRDLAAFYRVAAQDPRLEALVGRFRGLKPPRFPTLFEALVNAVACQQLSLAVGIHLLNRLAAAFGPAYQGRRGPAAAFPRARELAGAEVEDLRALGFSRSKGRSLVELSRSVNEGKVNLEGLETRDDEDIVRYLQSLRGIGRWSAEYALLRGLGRLQVFPGDDVGARHKLQAWLDLAESPDYRTVRQVLAPWHPFQGFIYFNFLLNHLAEEGYIQAETGSA
jgi:DNA-3-methyladenine glycosylase II